MASCVGITRIRFKGSGPRLALSQPGKPSSPVIGKIIAQAFIKCNTIPVQKRRSKAGPAQSIWRITAPAVRSKTKPDPSAAGPVWRGGAMDRADDVSFAISIKRRRSKADFAPTWSECNYRTWKNPVISMVCKQQARGFYLKNLFFENYAAQRDYGRCFHISQQERRGASPTGQPSGWLFLFHNEGGF